MGCFGWRGLKGRVGIIVGWLRLKGRRWWESGRRKVLKGSDFGFDEGEVDTLIGQDVNAGQDG